MWLLIVDVIRRRWLMILGTMTLLGCWWLGHLGEAQETAGTQPLKNVSMCAAFWLGPLLAFSELGKPVIRLMPVSRRDIWLAGVLVATVGAATFTSIAKVAAFGLSASTGGRASLGLSSIALSGVCDFLYCGTFAGLVTFFPLRSLPGRWRWWSLVFNILFGIFLVGGAFWALWLPVPMHWSDLVGHGSVTRRGLLVAAAGALTIAAFARTPAILARSRRERRFAAGLVRQRTTPAAIRKRFRDDLDGVALLAWGAWTGAVTGLVLFLLLDALVTHTIVGLSLHGWPHRVASHDTSFVAVLAFGFTAAATRSATGLTSMRVIRTLPLDVWRVAALIIGLPLFQLLIWYAALYAIHLAVGGYLPLMLRPDLLLGALGVAAIATMMSYARSGWIRLPLFVLVVGAAFTIDTLQQPPSPLEALAVSGAGVLLVAAAAWLTRAILMRSRTLYQPVEGRFNALGARG